MSRNELFVKKANNDNEKENVFLNINFDIEINNLKNILKKEKKIDNFNA